MSLRSAAEPRFKRRLEKKPPKERAEILECMRKILEDPHQNHGLRTGKLRVRGEDVWYSRAGQAKRVTWEYGDENMIVFRNHCDHDKVLRSP